MPTYARREGGAYARGETALARHLRGFAPPLDVQRRDSEATVKLLGHRDVEAGRAVDHRRAERAYQRRLLLPRLQLDEAHDSRRTPLMHQLEAVHRAVGLAKLEHALRQRIEIARLAQLRHHLGFHGGGHARAGTPGSISLKR